MSTATEAIHTGLTVGDLALGEEITFLEMPEQAGGDLLVIRVRLAPRAGIPPHSHPSSETFEILEGRLLFHLDGAATELRAGDRVTAESGRMHGMHNHSGAPVSVRVVATRGAEMACGLQLKMAMVRDGLIGADGRPKDFLAGALVLQQVKIYFPPLPIRFFRTLIAALAVVGRWSGREKMLLARYPDYARLVQLQHEGRQ